MTYHRGTLEEFNAWHISAMTIEGIPKIGFVNGVPAPDNQQTIAYSTPTQNPDNSNDYIWLYGSYPDAEKPDLSQTEINMLGWFASIP